MSESDDRILFFLFFISNLVAFTLDRHRRLATVPVYEAHISPLPIYVILCERFFVLLCVMYITVIGSMFLIGFIVWCLHMYPNTVKILGCIKLYGVLCTPRLYETCCIFENFFHGILSNERKLTFCYMKSFHITTCYTCLNKSQNVTVYID